MTAITSDKVISTILKHDTKVTSYKIALLRAINDVVLTYPDLRTYQSDVAVPLKLLAEFWVAYYWSFVDPDSPIQQGQKAKRQGQTINDMAFKVASMNPVSLDPVRTYATSALSLVDKTVSLWSVSKSKCPSLSALVTR